VDDALRNGSAAKSDWSGAQTIIEHIVHIFD
jgi:hypothetical protein